MIVLDGSSSRGAVQTGLFIGGKWRDSAPHHAGPRPVHRTDPVRRSPTPTPRTAREALDAAVAAQAGWAATRPANAATSSCRAPTRCSSDVDRLALVMTLEMGKPLAEARGEIAYAAEFFRWFAEEAVRIDGGYMTAPGGAVAVPRDQAAGGSEPADHAVELPDGDGHPQDRARDRRRMHVRHQAGRADAAVDARARRHPHRGRAAGRRRQRRHHVRPGERDRAADPRRQRPQAVVHRFDRGRASICSNSARRR